MRVMMMGEIHLGDVWIIGEASPWPAGWNIYHLIWRTMHNVHCTGLIEQLDFVVEIKLPDMTRHHKSEMMSLTLHSVYIVK